MKARGFPVSSRLARATLLVGTLGLGVCAAQAAPPPAPLPGPPCPKPDVPAAPPAPAPAAPAADGKPAALTTFEYRILSACDVIVLGTAQLVGKITIKGTTVARVEVEKVLKGTAENSFTLFVGGPRNTDDPRVRSPSTPYVDGKARRSVLFLRSTPNGSGLALETLFPVDDLEGQEKLEVLEQELVTFAQPDETARKRGTVALLTRFIASERPWTRTHGIREVESLSRRAPDAFDDASLARLDVLRHRIPDRSERAVLSATLDRLDRDGARRLAGAALPAPTEPVARPAAEAPTLATETRAYRRARQRFTTETDDEARTSALSEMARIGALASVTDLLEAFASPSAAVRERAAVLLADVGADESWPTLRSAFEAETEPAVREALVRAGCFIGTSADVAWVMRVSVGPALRRARCFALARLRTPEALSALTAEGEAARTATPPDTATASLVEYLAGPVFPKSDPALKRRPVAPSPPSPK